MKILVVDDHPMVRKGLIATLKFDEKIDEILEASSKDEGIMYILTYKPDIAFIDLKLGKENGLDIIEKVKASNVSTKYIILTSSMEREDFNRAQALDVGGYLLKEAFIEDILYALHVVFRGKKHIDPEIMRCFENKNEYDDIYLLTERERDVLKELKNGLSNQEIADKLYISEHTVKKHVSHILMKLGLSHRTQAALAAKDISNF